MVAQVVSDWSDEETDNPLHADRCNNEAAASANGYTCIVWSKA
jgi:hypothetical protein